MSIDFAIVLSGIAAIAFLFFFFIRRRPKPDLADPERALREAEVYLAFGRGKAAVQLLEAAIARHPEHAALKAKLHEIAAK